MRGIYEPVRPRTVKLIARILHILSDEGLLSVPEEREVIANLHNLAKRGTLLPPITPRLVNQREAAEMVGISYANFKRHEKEGHFTFKRIMIGGAVRYRNMDIIKFILAEDIQVDPFDTDDNKVLEEKDDH